MWWDGHSHLSFFDDQQLQKLFGEGRLLGVGTWVQGGYDSKDWHRQLELAKTYPDQIRTCLGIHPWALLEMDEDQRRQAWKELHKLAPEAHLIGETGIDNFRDIEKEELEIQEYYFRQHLKLACELEKPVVLHIVRAHERSLKIIDTHPPGKGGIVHAYSSSPDLARQYTQRGFLISVGPGLLKKGYRLLKETVEEMALKNLVIETDSPQSPEEPQLEPDLLLRVARQVADLKKVTPEEVLDQSRENLLGLGL